MVRSASSKAPWIGPSAPRGWSSSEDRLSWKCVSPANARVTTRGFRSVRGPSVGVDAGAASADSRGPGSMSVQPVGTTATHMPATAATTRRRFTAPSCELWGDVPLHIRVPRGVVGCLPEAHTSPGQTFPGSPPARRVLPVRAGDLRASVEGDVPRGVVGGPGIAVVGFGLPPVFTDTVTVVFGAMERCLMATTYSQEFKDQLVEQHRRGRSFMELGKEFNVAPTSIYCYIAAEKAQDPELKIRRNRRRRRRFPQAVPPGAGAGAPPSSRDRPGPTGAPSRSSGPVPGSGAVLPHARAHRARWSRGESRRARDLRPGWPVTHLLLS